MYHEEGSNKLLRNVDICLPLDMVQCPVSLGFQNYKIFKKTVPDFQQNTS